jgi:hypothetical protein
MIAASRMIATSPPGEFLMGQCAGQVTRWAQAHLFSCIASYTGSTFPVHSRCTFSRGLRCTFSRELKSQHCADGQVAVQMPQFRQPFSSCS